MVASALPQQLVQGASPVSPLQLHSFYLIFYTTTPAGSQNNNSQNNATPTSQNNNNQHPNGSSQNESDPTKTLEANTLAMYGSSGKAELSSIIDRGGLVRESVQYRDMQLSRDTVSQQ